MTTGRSGRWMESINGREPNFIRASRKLIKNTKSKKIKKDKFERIRQVLGSLEMLL